MRSNGRMTEEERRSVGQHFFPKEMNKTGCSSSSDPSFLTEHPADKHLRHEKSSVHRFKVTAEV